MANFRRGGEKCQAKKGQAADAVPLISLLSALKSGLSTCLECDHPTTEKIKKALNGPSDQCVVGWSGWQAESICFQQAREAWSASSSHDSPEGQNQLYPKKIAKGKKPLAIFIGMAGFEPATSRTRTERTSHAVLHPDGNEVRIMERVFYCSSQVLANT